MPNNSVGGVSVSVHLDERDALQQLEKLRRKMASLQDDLNAKRIQKDAVAKQLELAGADADAARLKVEQLKAALAAAAPADRAGLRAQLTAANAELREQTSIVNKLDDQYVKLTNEINAGEKSLAGMKNSAGDLERQVKASGGGMAQLKNAVQSATTAMEKGFERVGRMIKRVFVFTVILRALRGLRDYLKDLLLSFPQIRDAVAELKGNMLTIAQPFIERLIPAVQTLLTLLVQVSAVLADIVSKIFGATAAKSRESAEALNDQAKAYKKTGGAAAKAAKQLASFDQLNILNDNTSGGGSSSADGIAANFNGDIVQQIKDQIGAIEMLLGTALLVLGAILTFTGINIPLGVTLMALGLASIYAASTLGWDELKKQMQGTIGQIFTIVSAALLVIGAILTFTGANIPLGIALMIIGAAGLAAAVALRWDKIKEELRGTIGTITAIVSAALLVLGAILVFTGANIPLGVALMILGAAGLATVAVINWDKVTTALRGKIGTITAIVSGALLVLGAVLTFTGANLPLGIGLMVAGAVGLAATAALNWDKIVSALRGTVGKVMAVVSAALLVLGIILVATGVALPLGIALIVAGAAGLVTVAAINWDTIKQKIAQVWANIKSWWKANVAPIFTKEWWRNFFKSIWDGLTSIISDIKQSWSDMLGYLTGKNTIPTIDLDYQVSKEGVLTVVPKGGYESLIPTNSEFTDKVSGSNSIVDKSVEKVNEVKSALGSDKIVVENHVFLDSREIKSGQERLARVTGGGGR